MKHHPVAAGQRGMGAGLLLATPALALLTVFLAVPLLLVGRVSLQEGPRAYQAGAWTLDNYYELVGEKYYREVLLFTVGLGAGVTLLTLLIAYPLALFITGLGPRGKTLALLAVVLPKVTSMLVGVYGLELVLSNAGPVNALLLAAGVVAEPVPLYRNLVGVVIGETYLIVPYAVLVLVGALDRIDPELGRAARGLGASPWGVFRHVTLPLSLPGLFLAGELSLIWALGALLGPGLLGGPEQITLALEVQRQGTEYQHWPRASAVAVLMLLSLGVCLFLYNLPAWLLRRPR